MGVTVAIPPLRRQGWRRIHRDSWHSVREFFAEVSPRAGLRPAGTAGITIPSVAAGPIGGSTDLSERDRSRNRMSYVDAAVAILKAARRPLTVQEITEQALSKGFIKPGGKTPRASMSAALYLHVRDVRETHIRRVFRAGPTRAARDSVRWAYET